MGVNKIGLLELQDYFLGVADPTTALAVEEQLNNPASEVNSLLRCLRRDWSVEEESLLLEGAAPILATRTLPDLPSFALGSESSGVPLPADALRERQEAVQQEPEATPVSHGGDVGMAVPSGYAHQEQVNDARQVSPVKTFTSVLAFVLAVAAAPIRLISWTWLLLYRNLLRGVRSLIPATASIHAPPPGETRISRLKSLFNPDDIRLQREFGLLDLIVVICLTGTALTLSIPAIQSAREAARRVQCTYNLKQLALGILNYQTHYSTFPMGDHMGWDYQTRSLVREDFGHFVAITQFSEQKNIFNALNSNVMIYTAPNSTVCGFGVSALWCPSDGNIDRLRYPGRPGDGWDDAPIPMTFSSYAGNLGPRVYQWNDPSLGTMQGVLAHTGDLIAGGKANFPPVTIASITDGTSFTFLYGEHSHSQITRQNKLDYHDANWWTSGDYGETTFSTIFPPNYFVEDFQRDSSLDPSAMPQLVPRQGNSLVTATSNHPGGCNFAFCDGSVKFIKNSVDSWKPHVITVSGPANAWVYKLNGQVNGVYQALSTRNGGEVIANDAY
jgi:prepilin-type processing-associated H-X9-DG protein